MTELSTDLAALYPEHLCRYRQIYEDALEDAGTDGIVISSGSRRLAFLDDHPYPFKVNPHFKTWLPILDNDQCFIVLRPGQKPLLLFHQPEDYWHKPPADPEGFWTGEWDIQPVTSITDAHNAIGDPKSLAFIGEEADLAREWGFGSINPEPVLNAVHFERAFKTDYELACLQLANNRGAAGHLAAEAAFREGLSEFGIQHRYLGAIRHREQHTPYASIVALNENCAVLHYQHYEHEPPAEIRSMLIDAGADCNGYASDITRTWSYRSTEFQELIDAVEEQQQAIIADIRTGMNYADLHEQMHVRLANILERGGIVDMSAESMVEAGVTFTFLPHGLGHLLGLQTHDVGGYQQSPAGDEQGPPENWPALRLTRPVENRQVFTIEPGLYFIPMLLKKLKSGPHGSSVNWSRVDNLSKFGGIRIEDNVAIIDDAPVNLTRRAFETVNNEPTDS
ncbi:MAG: Xaa-Pro dipeptidase [Pseudomonadales bacterium]|nr:Xaa-Pro dipeptidase [Pseudomonadales bacterium]